MPISPQNRSFRRTAWFVPVTVANTGNTDYFYTGKESQNALFGINWYDSGARFQTTDGIFTATVSEWRQIRM